MFTDCCTERSALAVSVAALSGAVAAAPVAASGGQEAGPLSDALVLATPSEGDGLPACCRSAREKTAALESEAALLRARVAELELEKTPPAESSGRSEGGEPLPSTRASPSGRLWRGGKAVPTSEAVARAHERTAEVEASLASVRLEADSLRAQLAAGEASVQLEGWSVTEATVSSLLAIKNSAEREAQALQRKVKLLEETLASERAAATERELKLRAKVEERLSRALCSPGAVQC